ncbi:MAG: HAD-IB family hydrolase [Alphaproteobacteria bacterium]|nr:HAD-IB family hydrolase [Alphaproteobacteria bacterium]
MTVAFFDLDRTLIDVNSGSLWLREEWRRGRLRPRDAVTAVWSLTRYTLGAVDLDRAMAHAASVYRGMPEADLAAEVDAWFDVAVRPRLRPGAARALQAHRDAGDRTVVATSSSQFAAACARVAFGLDDAISTRVEVRDGVLTGGVETLAIGAHKLTACAAWADTQGVCLADATFYTDSYSDLAMLEAVGRPVIVDPDRRLRRTALARGWEIVDWGTSSP